MFGIEFDKLLLVGILVGVIVGPARLREWRRKLPQIVGRVHALYQQGRAEVTKDLDELAPDWREYDPRQLHPRRILRDLGADLRQAADGGDPGAEDAGRTGEPSVESSSVSGGEGGRPPRPDQVGDGAEDAPSTGPERPPRDPDDRGNESRDDEVRPRSPVPQPFERDAEGLEEPDVAFEPPPARSPGKDDTAE